MSPHQDLLPEWRLALAVLNRAIKDCALAVHQDEARGYLSQPSRSLRLFCDICGEEMNALNQECRANRLPPRLPRPTRRPGGKN